jgi:hypothetical protein
MKRRRTGRSKERERKKAKNTWSYETEDIKLHLWQDDLFDEAEVVWKVHPVCSSYQRVKVATKMVEHAISLDVVKKLFLRHDSNDLNQPLLPTKKNLQEVQDTLEQVPELNTKRLPANEYGATENVKSPSTLYLNRDMIEASMIERFAIRKYRFAFLIFVTTLHELGHWKLRLKKKRLSPKKHFPSAKGTSAESGEWIEVQLFGGAIGSPLGAAKLSKGLTVMKSNGKEIRISDEYIMRMVPF